MLTFTELETLCHRHQSEFYAFALRLTKDSDHAADLIQDVQYFILKYRDKFQRGSNFRAWVKTIIRNVFLSDYRRKKRRKELLEYHPVPGTWMGNRASNNHAESDLSAEDILRIVDSLPAVNRRSFLLHYRGMKYKDIARLTAVPIGTAKSRVFTARKVLRERLANRGIYHIQSVSNA
ncbi:RNA polymerase sigma factor [Lewinella sp. 4G2]|uniref:RNA polymerase sigma factor n=1 Tax=Lewinella sp. 4G2 TaxID=1803372 RepID=UPI0007B45FD1|nr:RNA polymerase sigma factor [Lewinella sp. 4G2]OAV44050.1 hypothetical protein A3850_005865 [Lewinella sp. 4G2]